MNFFTISTLVCLVTVGAVLGILGPWTRFSLSETPSPDSALTASNDIQDSVVLDDLPPPDDTYTPEQRRYS